MIDNETKIGIDRTKKILNGEKMKSVFGNECEFAIFGVLTEAMLCAGIRKSRMIETLYFASEAIDKLSVQQLNDSYMDFMYKAKKKSLLDD